MAHIKTETGLYELVSDEQIVKLMQILPKKNIHTIKIITLQLLRD